MIINNKMALFVVAKIIRKLMPLTFKNFQLQLQPFWYYKRNHSVGGQNVINLLAKFHQNRSLSAIYTMHNLAL